MRVDPGAAPVRTWPISDLLTEGCARALAAPIDALPGVQSAEANFAAGTLRVRYTRGAADPSSIAAAIRACGFTCCAPSGESGAPAGPPARAAGATGPPGHPHEDRHTTATRQPPSPTADAITAPKISNAGHAPAPPGARASDAHEGMRHAGDLHDAARDTRRRFVVELLFSAPLFIWSPMGMMSPPPTPFGLTENVWLWLLASG